MSNLPILPTLEAYPINDSSIKYACYSWLIPKSNTTIPVINFSGVIKNDSSLRRTLRYMRWRCEELIKIIPEKALILDLREVLFESSIHFDELLSTLNERQRLVRLVVNPQSLDLVIHSLPHTEVSADYEKVFSDLTFTLKDLRFDQGKTMLEPRKIQVLKLTPVSLNVSLIEFEGYTWKFQQDHANSGYIRFRGLYRPGSAGYEDSLFIRWRLKQFCEAVEPQQLIIDLRSLSYEWGDDIDLYPWEFSQVGSPIRFLLRPEQISSYRYELLETDIDTEEEVAFRSLENRSLDS
jgi:hypothetical protein